MLQPWHQPLCSLLCVCCALPSSSLSHAAPKDAPQCVGGRWHRAGKEQDCNVLWMEVP